MHPPQLAGLFLKRESTPLPLQGIRIDASVVEAFARVDVAQRFSNSSDQPLEVEYRFPLDSRAAVCSLVATVGGKRVVGRVQVRCSPRGRGSGSTRFGFGRWQSRLV